MANPWDERDDSSTDPDNDFESFLRRKVEQCLIDKPASQLSSIPESDSVEGAAVESKPVTPESIAEVSQLSQSQPVPVADEKVKEIEIRKNDLGSRVEEKIVEHEKIFQVDEEWIRISNESFSMAVVDLSCEQVIERIHSLNRLRFLIPAQQYGLQRALEELLKSRNAEDRQKLLEMDKAYRTKQKARSSTTAKTPKAPKEKKAGTPGSSKATPGTRSADELFKLGFDKGYIVNNLMERGLLDKTVGAYIGKLFEGVVQK